MNYTTANTQITVKELQDLAGIYINRATGMVWEVHVKDDDLVVEVPHFTFQLTRLFANRFKPSNSQIKIEIEFETVDQNCFMHVHAKGSEKAIFELLT